MQTVTPMTSANLLQNIALLALAFFGSRAHMSGDTMGQWASLIGLVTTLATNHLTVMSAGTPTTPPHDTAGGVQPSSSVSLNGAART